MTKRERMERKLERREEWAEGRRDKAKVASKRAGAATEGIPTGQPILVGHHSEGRHRRDLARQEAAMRKSVEHTDKAKEHEQKAANIAAQLDRTIYSDDDDAAERLQERIAELEAKRERMKAINAETRKGDGWAQRLEEQGGPLTEEEVKDLKMAAKFNGSVGYPKYALSNIGGNIRRLRKRLEGLS